MRHTWGDEDAGFVEDWIYVSSQLLHAIVFGLPPGGAFRHSDSFRTVFAADELLHVLQGTLVLANPETGEVVRAEPGESVFFRRDTWHHGFSYGDDALRVLEFFAPPPADRDVGRVRADEAVPRGEHLRPRRRRRQPRRRQSSGALVAGAAPRDAVWQLDRGVLVGLLVSTEHLTVGTVTVPPGSTSLARRPTTARSLLYVTRGELRVEAGDVDATLTPGDAFFVPAGTPHCYAGRRGYRRGDLRCRAELGAAGD